MAIPSVTTLTACGLGSCWHASQAFADASTLHSATCDATRHLLSGDRCGQWIMQPPPLPLRHSCLRPLVVQDFRNPNRATPNRMTKSTCCCIRCWNFLAVVRLVAPNRMCLVDYRQSPMGQNPMAVKQKRCRNCYPTCCTMCFLMDDDSLSRYSFGNRWCYRMADRYLDLRFGFPIRSGWWIRYCFRMCFQKYLCSQTHSYSSNRCQSSLVGLYCMNRYPNATGFAIRYLNPILIGFAIHSHFRSMIQGRWC